MADGSFGIPIPTDAGPAAIPCAGLAGAFGFPTTDNNDSSMAIQISTNKAVGQTKSITVGNGAVSETGPNGLKPGTSKITFPITLNTPPVGDLSLTVATTGLTATESQKPAIPNTDFGSLDGKIVKVKAGKTAGKISVTVYSDSNSEPTPELLLASITGVTSTQPGPDAGYTIVHGTALGTINDVASGAKVGVFGGDVSEGSNAGASPTKPATVVRTSPSCCPRRRPPPTRWSPTAPRMSPLRATTRPSR